MTDREMLEFAAKAGGIKVPTKDDYPYAYIDDRGIHRDISCGGDGTRMSHWNPLADDGDALRLAVKLNLNVHVDCQALPPSIIVENNTSQDPKYISAEEKGGALGTNLDLRLAATRLAITRCAVEIWKGMK